MKINPIFDNASAAHYDRSSLAKSVVLDVRTCSEVLQEARKQRIVGVFKFAFMALLMIAAFVGTQSIPLALAASF